ncbi:MAG: hypothetical protein J6V13_02505 [Paludibacteraceae bacterium]|nr:hypothetical protein [Paludibacteraceae bacterium]
MMKSLNVELYETPEVKVLTIVSEGVLCSSVTNSHEGFTFDDEEIL